MRMILSFICFLFLTHTADATSFSAPVEVTATTTSTQVMAANGFRSYLLIVNSGPKDIIVKFGSAQTANEGVIVPAGGVYEPNLAPSNTIWMKTTSSTSAVTLIQGQ